MKRRKFLALACFGAVTPYAALAQSAPVPLVGFLAARAPGNSPGLEAAFQTGLKEIGYVDGSNVSVDVRGDERAARLSDIAADLVRRRVNVLAAFSTAASRAAKEATGSIPIVFVTGDDPITAGLVSSLSRPTGNITGVTFISAPLANKRLEFFRMLVPNVGVMAVMFDPNSPESRTSAEDIKTAAPGFSQKLLVVEAGTESEIDAAFQKIVAARAGAVLVCGSPLYTAKRDILSALAIRHAIPSMYANRDNTIAGGLISYGASIQKAYRQAGLYVGQILKGAKPSDLPIHQPTQFELVLNLRTAKVLGLTIPDKLLALADEVIE